MVGWFSGLFNKLQWKKLTYFHTVVWLVTENFPLKHWFLRMELDAVKRIFPCLPNCNKPLIKWRYCLSSNLPEITQFLIVIISASQNSLLVVVINHTLSSRKFCDKILRHILEKMTLIPVNEFNCVNHWLLSSYWR